MERIVRGVARFQSEVFSKMEGRFQELATGQKPEALLVTCSDSRIVPELITQTGPGDLFVIRNAGNFIPPWPAPGEGNAATIEYAISHLQVPHVIICGHTDCGAMKGSMNPEALNSLPLVKQWVQYGDRARRFAESMKPGNTDPNVLAYQNVLAQLDNLRTYPRVALRVAQNDLTLHAWVYHIGTGVIDAYDWNRQGFYNLTENVYAT